MSGNPLKWAAKVANGISECSAVATLRASTKSSTWRSLEISEARRYSRFRPRGKSRPRGFDDQPETSRDVGEECLGRRDPFFASRDRAEQCRRGIVHRSGFGFGSDDGSEKMVRVGER